MPDTPALASAITDDLDICEGCERIIGPTEPASWGEDVYLCVGCAPTYAECIAQNRDVEWMADEEMRAECIEAAERIEAKIAHGEIQSNDKAVWYRHPLSEETLQ